MAKDCDTATPGRKKDRPFADRRKERFWSSTDGRDRCGTRDRFSQFLPGGEGENTDSRLGVASRSCWPWGQLNAHLTRNGRRDGMDPKILSGYGWPSGLTLHGQVDTVRKPALA